MEFVRPQEDLFESYRAACEESWQHGVSEWLPFEPEKYESWKAHALQIFEALESGVGLPDGYPRTVTVTCHEDNRASVRVIEKCGGVHQKTIEANGEVLRAYSISP